MELLIPGLILVALMVYASTRIKKTAASAFEEERVETDEFSIVKPEGFLHLIGGDSKYLFQAYSKEFGKDLAEDVRQAWIKLRSISDKDLGTVCDGAKNSGTEVVDEQSSVQNGRKTCTVQVERVEDGHPKTAFYKIVESNGKVYELESVVLKEQWDEHSRKINEMAESFQVK